MIGETETRADRRGRDRLRKVAGEWFPTLPSASLDHIVATTERDNLASQAVMRHLGMRMHENALDEPEWFQLVGILEGEAV